jgi:acylphosphatase
MERSSVYCIGFLWQRRKKMKRVLVLLVSLTLLGLVISCSSAPEPVAAPSKDLPDWVLAPPVADDAYYGVGSYKSANLSTARTAATANARAEIAAQVEVQVDSAVKQYAQEAGVDGNRQVIEFLETVTKQVASATLNGSKVVETYRDDDGTVYVMVMYEKSALREAAEKELFVRNEDAAFAEFKAAEAMKWLDAELEK